MNNKIKNIVLAGLFIALSIVIPMFMPKFQTPPFTFTLASHVPIFLAAFISIPMAAVVAIGSAVGFLVSGLPVYVAARAATHIVFAIMAAYMIKNGFLKSGFKLFLFLLITGIVHGLLEVLVVIPFGFGGEKLMFTTVVLGGGTVIHNAIDFAVAYIIYRALAAAKLLKQI